MSEPILYMCLEGKNNDGDPLYFIYSVTHSEFTRTQSDTRKKSDKKDEDPSFKFEVVINGGNRSMGCGLFGSKIVLAGGLVKGKETEGKKDKAVITYDLASKEISSTDIIPMRDGKFEPLVFMLNKKLYVLDTGNVIRLRSFEIYFPKQRYWHRLANPYNNFSPVFIEGLSTGCSRYSSFAFGKCLCISLPRDNVAHFHHSKSRNKYFEPEIYSSIPFYGMATTYYQYGYNDVVLISFTEGRVEGRRLCFPAYDDFESPKLIFEAESSSEPDCDLSRYFVDFGNGNFCLLTSDNVSIHVYMFKISRGKNKSDGSLNLRLLKKHMHKYDLTHFSMAGARSVRFVSSFAPSSEKRKEDREAELYAPHFPLLTSDEGDDDYELNEESREEMKRFSGSDESDSDLDEESIDSDDLSFGTDDVNAVMKYLYRSASSQNFSRSWETLGVSVVGGQECLALDRGNGGNKAQL